MAKTLWTAEPPARGTRNAICLRYEGEISEGWTWRVLLTSDHHVDSKDTPHRLIRKHLSMAVECDAPVFLGGDIFDVMQGKGDPRQCHGDMRKGLEDQAYTNGVLDCAEDVFGEYAGQITAIGIGNHCTAYEKHYGTNLVNLLVRRLNGGHGGNVIECQYEFAVLFKFTVHQSTRQSLLMYWNHGSGGASPATLGVGKGQKRQAEIRADIIASGHIHKRESHDRPWQSWNAHGKHVWKETLHITVPSYKHPTFGDGFEVQREMQRNKPGATWLEFYYEDGEVCVRDIKA